MCFFDWVLEKNSKSDILILSEGGEFVCLHRPQEKYFCSVKTNISF